MSANEVDNKLAGIVLAAGQSRRFGADKRLARFDSEHTLLSRSIELLLPVCSLVLVVTRAHEAASAALLLGKWYQHPRVVQHCAANSAQGMGSSLADGVAYLLQLELETQQQFEAVLVSLADMPYLQPQTVNKLVAAHSMDKIVVPCYQCSTQQAEKTNWGHPVIFGRNWFDQLQQLRGDRGGRDILNNNKTARLEIAVNDHGVLKDVDKPEDL